MGTLENILRNMHNIVDTFKCNIQLWPHSYDRIGLINQKTTKIYLYKTAASKLHKMQNQKIYISMSKNVLWM